MGGPPGGAPRGRGEQAGATEVARMPEVARMTPRADTRTQLNTDTVGDAAVSPLVRSSAAWAWRLLVILAAVVAVWEIFQRLEVVIVPLALAAMIAALLLPAVDFLQRYEVPRGAAVASVILATVMVFGGLLTFVVNQFVDGAAALVDQVTHSIDTTRRWLIHGPMHLSADQINHVGDSAVQALRNNQDKLTTGAMSTATAITEILTGAVLMLFCVIFLLYGGRGIFAFVSRIFPADVRPRVRRAGRAAFHTLSGYVRATFVVALVDAAGIGTGLAIMAVPLALPLASLVFLGAFIPLIGAVVSGSVAVIVALIAKGWLYALITLGVIIAVQQLEAHVLQPLVMGRAVSLHPIAVVLAIAAGGVLSGIAGALLAVPTLAFVNSAVRVLMAADPPAEEAVQARADSGPAIAADADDVSGRRSDWATEVPRPPARQP